MGVLLAAGLGGCGSCTAQGMFGPVQVYTCTGLGMNGIQAENRGPTPVKIMDFVQNPAGHCAADWNSVVLKPGEVLSRHWGRACVAGPILPAPGPVLRHGPQQPSSVGFAPDGAGGGP
jgi:hypothetical protein